MSDAEESSSNSPCETEEEDCTNIRPHKYEPAAADMSAVDDSTRR